MINNIFKREPKKHEIFLNFFKGKISVKNTKKYLSNAMVGHLIDASFKIILAQTAVKYNFFCGRERGSQFRNRKLRKTRLKFQSAV